jgi:hypothetical protein
MSTSENKLKPEDMKDLVPSMGYCIASNMITVDGCKVGFMYREEPDNNDDSGWRFLSGTEHQKYADNPKNSQELEVNVIANLDPAVIPYLNLPFGTDMERKEGTDDFRKI